MTRNCLLGATPGGHHRPDRRRGPRPGVARAVIGEAARRTYREDYRPSRSSPRTCATWSPEVAMASKVLSWSAIDKDLTGGSCTRTNLAQRRRRLRPQRSPGRARHAGDRSAMPIGRQARRSTPASPSTYPSTRRSGAARWRRSTASIVASRSFRAAPRRAVGRAGAKVSVQQRRISVGGCRTEGRRQSQRRRAPCTDDCRVGDLM